MGLQANARLESAPSWQWRNPVPQGNSLDAVTYGAGMFVAVGHHGAVVISTDGATWVSRGSSTDAHLFGIAYGNGTFVAVAESNVLTSVDGQSWSMRPLGMPGILLSVAFGNGMFLGIGDGVFVSRDGRDWTRAILPSEVGVSSGLGKTVAYANGLFFLVGEATTGTVLLSSPDGVSWSQQGIGYWSRAFAGAAYGNNMFVALDTGVVYTGPDGVPVYLDTVFTSPEGLAWTPWPGDAALHRFLLSVTFGNGRFVGVGGFGIIGSSTNGSHWQATASGTTEMLSAVAFGQNMFVAVGVHGMILTSPDAQRWTKQRLGTTSNLLVTRGNGTFLALASDRVGRRPILTSPDGMNWSSTNSASAYAYLSGLSYGQGTFVAFGELGTILTSADGRDWMVQRLPAGMALAAIAHANGLFVAVGEMNNSNTYSGLLMTSSDAVSWTTCEIPFGPGLAAVVYGRDRWLAIGPERLMTSVDGVHWVDQPPPWDPVSWVHCLAYGKGTFVAAGTLGTAYRSTDGISWTAHTHPFDAPALQSQGGSFAMNDLGYVAGRFVGVGDAGRILSSDDGAVWTEWPSPTDNSLFRIAGNEEAIVIAGEGGTLLQATLPANHAPVARCAEVIVAAGPDCRSAASIDADSFDPDGDPIQLSQSPPGPYPVGTNLVTLTVTDGHGASDVCTTRVLVLDRQPPQLLCPSDMTTEMDFVDGARVPYPSAAATDDCSGVAQMECVPPQGSAFPVGITTVRCTAVDAAGNGAACHFQVTVLGLQPILRRVLGELQATREGRGVGAPGQAKTLELAIAHLAAAVEASFWIDDTHLRPENGSMLFNELKHAVAGLLEIQHAGGKTGAEAFPSQQMASLVRVAHLLASIGVHDSAASSVARRLEHASNALAKGEAAAGAGRFVDALEHFADAWRAAQGSPSSPSGQ